MTGFEQAGTNSNAWPLHLPENLGVSSARRFHASASSDRHRHSSLLLPRALPSHTSEYTRPWMPLGLGHLSTKPSRDQKNKLQSTLMYLLALVVAMVGGSYAAVPLYRRFCQDTGYGGTVRRHATIEEKIARHAVEDASTARLGYTSIRFNVSALKSKGYFLEKRLTCLCFSTSIQNLQVIRK